MNNRLYMDETTLQPHDGFAPLQQRLMQLLEPIGERFAAGPAQHGRR